uniref:Putative secreted salivary protein n=1 Tax=Ixodes scapularis TaxID=6945 RepID=Q4PMM9_IXOSC|nr:putative secreted salivary protein [Ixodes scapularis]
MKATLDAVCFLATVVCTIALLPEDICRAPHAVASCAADIKPKLLFYFNNGTNRCESYYGCGGGLNDFGSKACCKDSCPYGKNKPNSWKPTKLARQ